MGHPHSLERLCHFFVHGNWGFGCERSWWTSKPKTFGEPDRFALRMTEKKRSLGAASRAPTGRRAATVQGIQMPHVRPNVGDEHGAPSPLKRIRDDRTGGAERRSAGLGKPGPYGSARGGGSENSKRPTFARTSGTNMGHPASLSRRRGFIWVRRVWGRVWRIWLFGRLAGGRRRNRVRHRRLRNRW